LLPDPLIEPVDDRAEIRERPARGREPVEVVAQPSANVAAAPLRHAR
jgi:hypothetical protein